ncbi:TetR/AcrR family transcriptional regulator [Pseudomonas rhizoryzae]|uniref:TetR/AcrR family transcriptional regulator n=1 Tax=Pseudomonas rhizoryzae TaxID=2571129 RepID=UPI0007365472|nr:TetR/AcrR family transcriptional regulator [Pseudomonas rhizoryzae]APQ11383.1 TetR family transcriptional regulator [Pseudomonas psychrotolerans]KTT12259.1 TetR family transcriptional regulator [Pseudomonas psychrotolerans]KTT24003.1 TetR family transcriptional regulator [Pseudomonas psychrotolerans]KTT32436.1 TetR family transcriptional regulator [Pseudomonas psychrotolerans]KTT38791.1 TetR family transcriptional regulator [Pseudomonas psychrotolerans]
MTTKQARPGGRSARVQQAIHDAVLALLQEQPRDSLTVPLIAARAGVTPSTLYRRWGNLPSLLADVELQRLLPDQPPEDTGSLRGDLERWLEHYVDDLASTPGQAMLRDALAATDPGCAVRCTEPTRERLELMLERAQARGEPAPSLEVLLDGLVAPLVYRTLFRAQRPDSQLCQSLLARALRLDD